ncbi:hypothetical protein ABZ883_14815 [Streptomyces sp. NPDC046977]|uniref:hypothetical protein n=1 Tax=Streptomyces sp. NPDC046977 TaxID=3154703 RepID=UPI0033EFD4AF
MPLGLIVFPMLTVLAAACLAALAPGQPWRWLLPAARTAFVLSAAAAYIVILFSLGHS